MGRDAIDRHEQAKAALDQAAHDNVDEETFAWLNREVIDTEDAVPPWRR